MQLEQRRVALTDVLITDQLQKRVTRLPNLSSENKALVRLAKEMVQSPEQLLQSLVDIARDLCDAGSAGISLLETAPTAPGFRWVALSGEFAPAIGATTQRDFSPCSVCLEYDSPQLFAYPERYFTYLQHSDIPPMCEELVIPFAGHSGALGAIWIVTHDPQRHFDREDVRIMTSLAAFSAAAMEMVSTLDTAKQAAETAEAALHVRDQFIWLAAHELKTPLTSLLGNAQLLQRRVAQLPGVPERDVRIAQVLTDQAMRLSKMAVSLLDITRISVGRLYVKPVDLDLAALVRTVVDETRLSLDTHQLIYRELTAPVLIEGDASRLDQVCYNLIQNAIKYSPKESIIEVEVSTRDGKAYITVSDQGIGIPQSEIPHLFERFYRASNTKSYYTSGLGIGLYVTKEIVTLHGGQIEVSSEVGAGSTFIVELPLAVK